MTLIDKLKARARTNPQRIVLSEGEDPRIISAAAAISREGFAKITLIGRKHIIESVAADSHASIKGLPIIDPATNSKTDAYADLYYERRRSRGISLEESRQATLRPLY